MEIEQAMKRLIYIIFIISAFLFARYLDLTTANHDINITYAVMQSRYIFSDIEKRNYINHVIELHGITERLATDIYDIANKVGVDYKLFFALIYTESRFNKNAVSSSGAYGLCQIKPIAVREVKRLYGLDFDRFNTIDNLYIGAYFIKGLIEFYRFETIEEVLTFYNAGAIVEKQKQGKQYAKKILSMI